MQQLRLQDKVAQLLKGVRMSAGALGLTTLEAQAVYEGSALADLRPDEDNRAKELIEYFMIAANGVVAPLPGGASLRLAAARAAHAASAGHASWSSRAASGETLPPARRRQGAE